MTIRLLVEGHSDPASAKRLGVSTRTYAGYIAALKEEYGVQTRFQLGYAMGRPRPYAGRRRGPPVGRGRDRARGLKGDWLPARCEGSHLTVNCPRCAVETAGGWHWTGTAGG